MNRFVVLGLGWVLVVEVMAFVMVDRRFVLWLSGAVAAVVLLEGRRLLVRAPAAEEPEILSDPRVESMRRWITRTESMIRWADSSRADWDRHLRPRLAREFMVASGQKQGGDPAAMQATGRMVFGYELWQWVDPGNVALNERYQPGPGRGALSEILERLERI